MSNTPIIEHLIEMRTTIEEQRGFFILQLQETKETMVSKFQQIISDLTILLEHIDQTLKAECVHTYVEDWIDITPERSQKITYCSTCHCTF
uniref:Uncharacterized protein n=1 Tax=viral metagenome TaxID=1070528 RepID=A0A6C0LCT0_9ZZZZ